MQLQVGVKLLIKNHRGQYLFIERSKPVDNNRQQSWDIPGGRINPDESLDEALKREVQEEIGIDITNTPKLVAAQDIFAKDKALHVVRLTYLVSQDASDINLSDEHKNYKWLSSKNFDSVSIEPFLREVLDKHL